MHIIIDGYNLIRQSDSLRRAERISLEAGRDLLLSMLAAYNRKHRHRITVVFDGWREGSSREEHGDRGGVHVVYSRRGERADEVIGRMCSKSASELVVVSSDREVALQAVRSGGVAIASPEFEAKLLDRSAASTIHEAHDSGEDAGERDAALGTKKKGPARRLSKRERRTAKAVRKL